MPQYHTGDCWCPTCTRYRARLAALEEQLAKTQALLASVLVDRGPPTEEEIAYARELVEAGR
jgi:hypothetical protein